ncbi:unknown [Firmicutes bacterium CAG:552]|nr:unknown [Firmicutes bacterium CAG:552]
MDKTLTGNIADFVNTVNTRYRKNGGKFDTLSEFDFALLAKCIGEITLKDSSYKSQIKFPYATTAICKIYACTSKDGNVLTYPESYAFTYYLIEKYGFNNVLKCCIDYNLADIFGSNYNVIMDEFMKSII